MCIRDRIEGIHHAAAGGDELLLAGDVDEERGAEGELLFGIGLAGKGPAGLAGGLVQRDDLGLGFGVGIEDEEVFEEDGAAAIAMHGGCLLYTSRFRAVKWG